MTSRHGRAAQTLDQPRSHASISGTNGGTTLGWVPAPAGTIVGAAVFGELSASAWPRMRPRSRGGSRRRVAPAACRTRKDGRSSRRPNKDRGAGPFGLVQSGGSAAAPCPGCGRCGQRRTGAWPRRTPSSSSFFSESFDPLAQEHAGLVWSPKGDPLRTKRDSTRRDRPIRQVVRGGRTQPPRRDSAKCPNAEPTVSGEGARERVAQDGPVGTRGGGGPWLKRHRPSLRSGPGRVRALKVAYRGKVTGS